jgi:quinolinate synthase
MENSELQKRIKGLLREKNAILLVHYYQRGEVQEIADLLGDSFALSVEAAKTDADVIVFAGVHFMAESAYILSPQKKVLLPRPEAGCPLADMVTPEEISAFRKENPGVQVVSYVNSSAAVKAQSDICCTSSNVVKVVNSLKADRVLMVPDGNLARYAARFTQKEVIPWKGYCPVHHLVTAEEVLAVKAKHPQAVFACHPECNQDVVALADFVGSTAAIIRFATETKASEIIVGTEQGIFHALKKANPEKTFIAASDKMVCETMKLTTLEDIYRVLDRMENLITVPEEVRAPAALALRRMLEAS